MWLLSMSLFVAWASPWELTEVATAPWLSRDRETSRVQFFDELNSGALFQKSSHPRAAVAAGASSREMLAGAADDHELREIPWAAHRALYPQLNVPAQRGGQWQWPVASARVTSGFGIRGGKPHEGLDLRAPYNSRVNAAGAGRVVFAGSLRGYGQTVVVYHGSGWSSVYAHLSSIQTARGRVIERGDRLGFSGDSGTVSGPHLHFEMRRDGQPVNPLSLTFGESPYLASSAGR